MDDFRLFAMEAIARPPVELIKTGQKQYNCKMSLPLPPQLLIFSQGSWPGQQPGTVKMEIFLDKKRIGTMTNETKCFSWDVEGLEARTKGEQVTLEMNAEGLEPAADVSKSKQDKTSKEKSSSKENKHKKLLKMEKYLLPVLESEEMNGEQKNESTRRKYCKTRKINDEEGSLEHICKQSSVLVENTSVSKGKDTIKQFTHLTNLRLPKRGRTKRSTDSDEMLSLQLKVKESSTEKPAVKRYAKKTKQTRLAFATASKRQSTGYRAWKKNAIQAAVETSRVKLDQLDCNSSAPCSPSVQSLLDGDLNHDDGSSGETVEKKKTELADWDVRSEAQIHNETTPHIALTQILPEEMKSPFMQKPAKKKRKQSGKDLQKTPDGAIAKKRGYCMRASTGDGTPRGSRVKTALADTTYLDTEGSSATAPGVQCSQGRKTRFIDLSMRMPQPTARWGHTMLLTEQRRAVLIGGQGDKQQLSKDSIWTLNTDTRKWESLEIQSEGQKPEYRMGHTATFDPTMRCIYIYGGSKHSRWFHDVHVYDLDENKWSLAKVSGKAPTRAYHTSCLHRHELWVFGGVYPRPDPNPDGCSNEIHIFSPVMQTWYTPLVLGDKPLPRSGHSATVINDQMVLFGGWDAPFSYNDLFILDLITMDWTKPDVKGTPPKPRCWHASTALSNRRILIHGGYDGDFALSDTYIFDLNSLFWSRLVVEGSPKARAGHAAVCLPYHHDSQEDNEVLVFGGGDNDGEFFSDLQSYFIPFTPMVGLN